MLTNIWFWLFIVAIVSRNVVAALPKPGDSPEPTGFGSNSVGYQFAYRLVQGLSFDAAALGKQLDMRNMRPKFDAPLSMDSNSGVGEKPAEKEKEQS